MLVQKEAAIQRENGLASEALLLQRRVVQVVVTAVNPVKAAESRWKREMIRDIIRTIEREGYLEMLSSPAARAYH